MMDIKVKCADCGRHIGTFVRLGGRKDTAIEIHACYHKDTYNHIKEQAKRIKDLEAEETAEVKHPIDSAGKMNLGVNYCYYCGQCVRDQKYCQRCGRKLIWQKP